MKLSQPIIVIDHTTASPGLLHSMRDVLCLPCRASGDSPHAANMHTLPKANVLLLVKLK